MEAVVLRRSFENLGLQLLFSQVGSLVGVELPPEIPEDDRQALLDLKNFLRTAIDGLELQEKRRKEGYASLATLNDSVKAERAYLTMSPVLPQNCTEQKDYLYDLMRIAEEILKRPFELNGDRVKLHGFCRKFLSYLDRERFATLKAPQNLWP